MNDIERMIREEDSKKTMWNRIKEDIEYYLVSVPKSWYYDIRLGIKSLIKRIPYIWKLRDWDYGYIIEAEMNEMIILRDGIKKYQNHLNWERDVETLNVAISLASELSNGYCDDKKVINTNLRNMGRFISKDGEEYVLRILNTIDEDTYKSNEFTAKSIVRDEKVWNLYHKYRSHYMRGWWD